MDILLTATTVARRTVLVGAAAALLALAGPALPQSNKVAFDVGYLPILPMAQLFVMEGEGWLDEAGIVFNKTRFSSGPAMVQAIASGKMEMMWIGIGPAMVARANGIDIKVVAANVIEQVGVLAVGRLAEVSRGSTSAGVALAEFTKAKGRRPKFATLPKGSVPDTVLRYWLLRKLGMRLDDVEIVGMGAGRVQQALLAGAVDGASILEPVLTVVREAKPDAYVMGLGGELFPNQPGAVVAVRGEALAQKRGAIDKIVALHIRATKMLRNDPKRAARHVHAAIGAGLIKLDIMQKAVVSPANNFVSDPRVIVAATKVMHDFSAEMGTLRKKVPLDLLFDSSVYEAAEKSEK
ncbi:MAG: nitrate ABC transporter substrate-binding protein [Betaproteobacteria bacterium RIFCSPLOWO2_02_FULL_63_19]|nr:MAG: nitrate ABC transporter substrate-binding protein [Betaproteobacteria bacterium RIFCSPLOWO2_02_FULL_63_19]